MLHNRERELLKEYVKLLVEDDGGDGGFGFGDMGPFGMQFGSQSDLYNIFIRPFTDVAQTAAGKTKSMVSRTVTLAHVMFEAIATTLIPILASEYGEIFQRGNARLEKIEQEYKEVYDSTWSAFRDNDIALTAFFYKPTMAITAHAARLAPKALIKSLSLLSGGSMDSFLSKVAKKFDFGDIAIKPLERKTGLDTDKWSGHGGGGWGDGGGGAWMESFIREDEQKKEQKKPDIGKILSSEKVMNALETSQVMRKLQSQIQNTVNSTLNDAVNMASEVFKANTVEQLVRLTKKNIPEVTKLKSLPQQERAKAEKVILMTTKKSIKKLYTDNLEKTIKQAQSAGVPSDHPFIAAYHKAIDTINKM